MHRNKVCYACVLINVVVWGGLAFGQAYIIVSLLVG